MKKIYLALGAIIIGILIIPLTAILVYFNWNKISPSPTLSNSPATSGQTPTQQSDLDEPISEFKQRMTKKPFGIYISPQDSPVQPEKFTGYHTGVDIEYEDATNDIPVYAISDGEVMLSRTASGYGGVIILKVKINNQEKSVLYGHIRPQTLPEVGQKVSRGAQIGLLGTGYSAETDGERKHLHFAILSDDRLDLKGYVNQKEQLSGWLNPLEFY